MDQWACTDVREALRMLESKPNKEDLLRVLKWLTKQEEEQRDHFMAMYTMLVLEGAGGLTVNHRLQDAAIVHYRMNRIADIEHEARKLCFDDATVPVEMLQRLYPEEGESYGFSVYWEHLQRKEAQRTHDEAYESLSLLDPGEGPSVEKLLQWRSMTRVDQAHAINEWNKKRARNSLDTDLQLDECGNPVMVKTEAELKELFGDCTMIQASDVVEFVHIRQDMTSTDPERIARVFRADMAKHVRGGVG